MKKTKVISYKNFPTRKPVLATAVAYLYLDKYETPGWAWGVVITLFSILWILSFVASYYQEDVNIFSDDKPELKSKFAERIEELKNRNKVN